MFLLFEKIWIYKAEILLAIELLSKLRKSAQKVAREYIRRQIETRLRESIVLAAIQIGLFCGAATLNDVYPSLTSRLVASSILWTVTIYNVFGFFFLTVPEIRALHATLKGKTGYAFKYILEVSLVTELLRLNTVFLVFCLVLGISTRIAVGTSFSYTAPWKQALHIAPHHHHRRLR